MSVSSCERGVPSGTVKNCPAAGRDVGGANASWPVVQEHLENSVVVSPACRKRNGALSESRASIAVSLTSVRKKSNMSQCDERNGVTCSRYVLRNSRF